MSDSRSRILQRLRDVGHRDKADIDTSVISHSWSKQEKLERFSERMSAVRAEIHRTREQDWSNELHQILKRKGARNLAFAPDSPRGKLLQSELSSGGIAMIPYNRKIEQWQQQLFEQVDASFTGCLGGIAETGSLILWPDETEPRLLSLVPPIHCVLLLADQIYSTFAEAMEAQDWVNGMPTNALLISGPSKSADIAQVLAYGVHGPKSLVVLIIDS